MQRSRSSFVAIVSITTVVLGSPGARPCRAQAPAALTGEQRQSLADAQRDLQTALDAQHDAEGWVDAAVWQKGLAWALRYDREFKPADVTLLQRSVERCRERLAALADGRRPWTARRGKTVLGYVSRVDGSVQPYGVAVPQAYDPATPIRLDVVLHGSSRPVGMSELRFMAKFDEGDGTAAEPPDQPFIELHPLGRVENCYRWAGETDVFEAIDDVCRRYAIDRDRIVLRGMSMGASGTWHLGLKHPGQFVALGPYCGYVDTHHFSETPLPNFVKVGPLPEWQETGLHLLDSIDYAANAGVVPVVACIGEKDVFFQAHVLMGEAMQREGLTLVNLISPGTGHVIDPVTHAEQMRRIAVFADKGINHTPRELRFVTWTLKYSRCHWLQLLGLDRHYARAEITGHLRDDDVEIDEPRNVTSFAIIGLNPTTIHVGQSKLAVPDSLRSAENPQIVLRRDPDGWRIATGAEADQEGRKKPGLQGPIDDAFTSPFLCVRGTGKPWNPAIGAYADAALNRFADEWEHYFRGVLPVKDDTEVTDDDLRTRNLILFGDPGSNRWISRALPRLPVTWTRETLRVGSDEFAARDHLPALIAPSPFADGADRYIVLNSGHTFHETELASLNYLLFPRWGDWAVLRIDPDRSLSAPAAETVVRAGFFDEDWRIHD